MKMTKRFGSFALFLTIVLFFTAQVMAVGNISVDPSVDSLIIFYRDGDEAIIGAQFMVYRAAELSKDGQAMLTGGFSQLSIRLDGADARALAGTLYDYVQLLSITPNHSDVTDEDGIIKIEDLERGVYLIVGQKHTQNGQVYTTAPLVVTLDGSGDVTVNPKFSITPDKPIENLVTRKVLKVWEDGGKEAMRPSEIHVTLMRDGEVYKNVTLNAENEWRYSFSELDGAYSWTAAEYPVPDGYTVLTKQEGITFVITNKREAENHEPEPDQPKLPQTGQIWRHIPMLAAAGLLFVLIGLIRRIGAER